MSTTTYDGCIASSQGNDTVALQCLGRHLTSVSNDVQTVSDDVHSLQMGVDIFFLIFAATIMFFMQAGFTMLCAGSVRAKNLQNTIMKNVIDACGSGLAFFVCGYAFAYGGSAYTQEPDNVGGEPIYSEPQDTPVTFIGHQYFFLIDFDNYAFYFYQYAFAATATTIVAGTLAERCQMLGYLCYSSFLTAFVYPVIAHAIWSNSGFLATQRSNPLFGIGVIDFAGSGVVHVTGGFTALIASRILGPRKGRFDEEKGIGLTRRIEGNSSSLQALGCLILWFGWYGFNCGSVYHVSKENLAQVAALITVTTTLGACSGAMTSLVVTSMLARRQTGEVSFDLSDVLNGCLAGLVSITAGCGLIEPWAAVVIGAIGGIVYIITGPILLRLQIDDAVEAIPVHLGPGIWGMISVALFASPRWLIQVYGSANHPGLFYSFTYGGADAHMLAANCVGLLFILGWVLATMLPFFLFLSYLGWFRTDSLEEIIGLDPSAEGADTITKQHLDILRRQINTREGINEEESRTLEEEDEDRFDSNHP